MIKLTKELLKKGASHLTSAVNTTIKNSFNFRPKRFLKNTTRPLFSYIIMANFGVYALWNLPYVPKVSSRLIFFCE
jgi:hypothetical protein